MGTTVDSTAGATMLEELVLAVPKVITMVGQVADALVSADGELHSLLGMVVIGVAMSGFKFAIGGVRSLIWGA